MKKVLPIAFAILLPLCCLLLLTTCQKEYSYEGGMQQAGTAEYFLTDSNGICGNSTVHGNYYEQVALDASNTVSLEVDVTKTGTFSLSINEVNGIKFSASGSFNILGKQFITLAGGGKAKTVGSFNFKVPVGAGCSFSVTVTKPPVAQVAAKLSGDPGTCVSYLLSGSYTAGKALTTDNTVSLHVIVATAGAYTISTDTLDGVFFSASGNFTSTGDKTVILAGHGTPEFPRNLDFTPRIDGSSCSFPLTIQNAEPVAVYVLESGSGTPNPCVATVAGDYKLNTTFTADNYVEINVYVSVPGNYTIATAPIDGMMFASSGTFTTAGTQKVKLAGKGKPAEAGNFTFIPMIVGPAPLGGSSCGFSIAVK